MNSRIIISGCIFCILFFACKKNTPGYVDDKSSFDASMPVSTISLNDSANFLLTENPDVISFYSGELGNNYDNRERTVLTGGTLNMKFQTRVVNQIADTLDVMISTNFNGTYDSASVANATWKRMTDMFLYPTPATPLSTFVPSGNTPGDFTNISSSVIPGQPFYLAFKYDVTKQNNIQWSIGSLGMYNFFSNGNPNATVIDSTTNSSASFAEVSFGEPTNRWSKTSTLYKYINSTSAVIGASHWYISRPLNPDAVKPDLPIAIKNISQSALTRYSYKYSAPGTYKAVFVASYNRLNFQKTIVKEFTVIVQ